MISEKESDFSEQVEATLIKQAQAGSQESLNVLLLWHERLVHLTTLPFCCFCFDVPIHIMEQRTRLFLIIIKGIFRAPARKPPGFFRKLSSYMAGLCP